ncbi:MAG: NAD-dependent epimerase/dehydratase family protein [Bacteroidota bacterium]|nr:NAD-dependent epimerase/dehydratase family protein [Bacteroidota bacterium]
MISTESLSGKRILVTGAAGFIGFHVCLQLTQLGVHVLATDNINDYYQVDLKHGRLRTLGLDPKSLSEHNDTLHSTNGLIFIKADLEDSFAMENLFSNHGPVDFVIHLGAQAGVRYSLQNPRAYADSNITGFLNVLEGCRLHEIQHLIFASSSSVYGMNASIPFTVADHTDHPVSFYAATKKANEVMAHSYSHLYNIPTTGLRFFTVYGPWGRPDMAPYHFTKQILEGNEIQVFNNGDMYRDFTYINDIVESIIRLIPVLPSKPRESNEHMNSTAPYALHNIGNNSPVKLMDFIKAIENATGRTAIIKFLPMQAGDVQRTYADVESLIQATGFRPKTTVQDGMNAFVNWYREYYKI